MSETTARELLPGRGTPPLLPFWQRVIGELQLLRVNLGGWRNAKFHSALLVNKAKQMYGCNEEGFQSVQQRQSLSGLIYVRHPELQLENVNGFLISYRSA